MSQNTPQTHIVALKYLTSLLNVASSLVLTVREGAKNIQGGVLKMGGGATTSTKNGSSVDELGIIFGAVWITCAHLFLYLLGRGEDYTL